MLAVTSLGSAECGFWQAEHSVLEQVGTSATHHCLVVWHDELSGHGWGRCRGEVFLLCISSGYLQFVITTNTPRLGYLVSCHGTHCTDLQVWSCTSD